MLSRCGFFICQGGWALVEADGQRLRICYGDLFIYVTSSLVRLVERSEDLRGVIVEANVDFILPILNRVVNPNAVFHMRSQPLVRLWPAQRQRLEMQVVNICTRVEQSPLSRIDEELVRSMSQTLVLDVLKCYFERNPYHSQPQTRQEQIFQTFMLALFRHHMEHHDVTFYAELQHITPRHLTTLVSRTTGHSPMHWISQMIVSAARQLLEGTELSVKQIAEQLHFPSQTQFGKYFKLHTGLSPQAFRRTLGQA